LVSQHSKPGETPNLIGKGLAEAAAVIASLSNTNFQPELGRIAYAYSDTIPAGRISGQQPLPGSILQTRFQIDLLVSKGSESLAVVLTNFAGMTPDEAINWLSFNHLTAAFLPEAGAPADRIVGQEPSAGTPLNQGSQVRLRIGGSYKYGVFDFIFPLYLKLAQANLSGQRELAETATATNTNVQPLSESGEAAGRDKARDAELQRTLLREGTRHYRVTLVRIEGANRTVLFQGEKNPGERLLVSFRYENPVTIEMQVDGNRFIRKEYR
jgi:beta-lactam-binding protein with PASTA domain